MNTKPDLPDETLLACLAAQFGLTADCLTFLPLGGDLGTAVYRVETTTGAAATPTFCKLRRGEFDPASVELPRLLYDSGIREIIPPLVTTSGRLWAALDEYSVIVYPFVSGEEGYDVELTDRQWATFGAAMRRIHTTAVLADLSAAMARETYSPEWRDRCRRMIDRLADDLPADPLTRELAALLRPRRDEILAAVDRADALAAVLATRDLDFVLCHGDIHPGNLHITPDGTLYIIDWDYPMLAPRERDLMFIGGGQGFMATDAEQEVRLFYRGYGDWPPDPQALTYYRYDRGLTDLTVEGERVLSASVSDADRAQALVYLGYYCLPDNTLAIAAAMDGGV
jgi:spectinomycin phosphotransferase